MIWRPHHEWTPGAVLPLVIAGIVAGPSGQLSSCPHCAVTRYEDWAGVSTTYLRRAEKESERVSASSPPCVSSGAPFRAPW